MANFGNSIPPLDFNALQKRYQQGQQSAINGNNSYLGSNPSPHVGGGLDKSGYQKRDQEAQTRKKQFLMNQLKSGGF